MSIALLEFQPGSVFVISKHGLDPVDISRRARRSRLKASQFLVRARGFLNEHSIVDAGIERLKHIDVETIAESAQFSNSEWEEVREFMTFLAVKKHRGSK